MHKTLIALALGLSLLISEPASAQYSKFQPTLDQFMQELQQIDSQIDDYHYDKAYQHYNHALILYRRALTYASRSETDSAAEVWQINLAFQFNLAHAALGLGQRFHDTGKYAQAIAVYSKAHEVSPYFPAFIFERGLAYYMLGQKTQAAQDFYTAKRLNQYPAKRKITSPLHDDELLGNPYEIEGNSNAYLLNLGYSPYYPLETDPQSQRPTPLRIVPGIGAQLQQQGRSKAAYFGMSQEQLTADFAFPQQQFEPQLQNGQQVYAIEFEQVRAVFLVKGDQLKALEIRTPGAEVSLLGKNTRIGDHARQVLAHFGKGFGYEKYRNDTPVYPDVKEFIDYPEFGLVFGLGANDHVSLILIYAQDPQLLSNQPVVNTELVKPEILRLLGE